jgi:hypothetical protein
MLHVSLIQIDRRFRGSYSIYHRDDRPDDGSSKYLWKVSNFLPD